jgi:hypothetical protein
MGCVLPLFVRKAYARDGERNIQILTLRDFPEGGFSLRHRGFLCVRCCAADIRD